MGNSQGYHHFLTVKFPESINAACINKGGHITENIPGSISMKNMVNCATGCGGEFTFTHTANIVKTTYRCEESFKSADGRSIKVGNNITVKTHLNDRGSEKVGSITKLARAYGISTDMAQRCFLKTDQKQTTEATVSVAYIYHCYYDYDWVSFSWSQNDLHLLPRDSEIFNHDGNQYVKVHPKHCHPSEGPHKTLSAARVQSRDSPLVVEHKEHRTHYATVQIDFQKGYKDEDGEFTTENHI